MVRVAVVGGGASGASVVAHLLRAWRTAGCAEALDVVVFERDAARPWWGGAAYGTCAAYHVINVPCRGMHLLEQDTDGMERWLRGEREAGRVDAKWGVEDTHIPRHLVQRYFEAAVRDEAAGAGVEVRQVREEVASITALEGGVRYCVHTAAGRQEECDYVAMCTGNFPPENIPCRGGAAVFSTSRRYHKDPWRLFRDETAIPKDAAVGILGSRLSAIDTLQCLQRRGHRGAVHVFSRKGLYPKENAGQTASPAYPFAEEVLAAALRSPPSAEAWTVMSDVKQDGAAARAGTAGSWFATSEVDAVWRRLLAVCDRMEAAGENWQRAVDALRPYHNKLWLAMNTEQRRLFLQAHRDEFEIRRHRLAPHTLRRLAPFLANVPHHRGGVAGVAAASPDAPIVVALAEGPKVTVDHLINCTGPQIDFRHTPPSPLFAQLVRDGLIAPEPTGIGLLVDPISGRALAPDLTPAGGLFLVGPIRRGTEWETIAVKEIRRQGSEVATAILDSLRARGAPAKL